MNTFAVGDIHGAHKALVQCLERSGFDKEVDTLISLGDVADGWSEVPECVDELLSIKNLISIRGNHDEWCARWFRTSWKDSIWTSQGGQATIDAYLRTGQVIDEAHRIFWANQINYHVDSENRLFVHGGYSWDYPIEDQPDYGRGNLPFDAIYYWDRGLWKDSQQMQNLRDGNGDSPSERTYEKDFKEIFVGHNRTDYSHEDLKPVNVCNVWNIDQGSAYTGKLTIMDVDTKEYWQSDIVKELYPDESGR